MIAEWGESQEGTGSGYTLTVLFKLDVHLSQVDGLPAQPAGPYLWEYAIAPSSWVTQIFPETSPYKWPKLPNHLRFSFMW